MSSSTSFGTSSGAPPTTRPLLVTADPDVLEDVLRLSAVAGVEPEVAPDLLAARGAWSTAPLVIVAAAAVRSLAAAGLLRRAGVVVLGGIDDGDVWRRAVAVGAEEVLVLPDDETKLVDRLSECHEHHGPAGMLIGVIGGRGGAGASTLAAALAVTASRQLSTVLVDADPLGGGIDMLLGGEDTQGLRWPDFAGASGRVAGEEMRRSLPRMGDLLVLSWDRGDLLTITPEAMRPVLAAAMRGSDLVVVDLPRRLDAAAEVALSATDLALMVVPAEVRATASAARVASAAAVLASDLRVVVRGPSSSGLPAEAIADALGLGLAGEIRTEPALAAAAERGEPPVRRGRSSLGAFCDGFLATNLTRFAAAA